MHLEAVRPGLWQESNVLKIWKGFRQNIGKDTEPDPALYGM